MSALNVRGLILIIAAAIPGHLISFFLFNYDPEKTLASASIFMIMIDLFYRFRQDNLTSFHRWFGSRGGGSAVFMPVWLFGIVTFTLAITGQTDL